MTTRRHQSKKTPVILRGTAKDEPSADMVISDTAVEEAETAETAIQAFPELERAADAAGFVMAAAIDVAPPELLSTAEAWRSRTLRLWSDNTQAWLDLAGALGEAPTPGNMAQLQAQFACDRFCALMQASNDYLALARETAEESLRSFPKLFVAAA